MAFGSHSGKITPIELVFWAAILFVAFATIVPQVFHVRDSVRVELAALQLERCDHAADEWLHGGDSYTNRVTLAMIAEAIYQADKPPLKWPAAALLDTFEKAGTNRASVVVRVHGGERIVTAADLEGVNHAN